MAVDDARKAQNAADDERDLEDAEHVFDFFKWMRPLSLMASVGKFRTFVPKMEL